MEEMELQRFFSGHPAERALFDALYAELLKQYPTTRLRVLKTQINFLDPLSYAIVSLPRKKADGTALIFTLGMAYPCTFKKIFACTKIHEHRWTWHILLKDGKLDEGLLTWIEQARQFAGIPASSINKGGKDV